MAFESLSDKLQDTFSKLKGKGVLTEEDIDKAMREVKLALLEADVNFKVVKEFVADVKEKALGSDVLNSLTPGQQVIKIVNDELIDLMGGTNAKLTYSPTGFTTILIIPILGWIVGFAGLIFCMVLQIMGIVKSIQGNEFQMPWFFGMIHILK